MSASLVGSEMCIRDRNITLRAELIATNQREVSAIYICGVGPQKRHDWFHWEDEFLDPLLS
eukprot:12571117-Alexandrium_andersonii.AAC.1